MIIPIILSGGSGTRLWPLSRKDYPKQYHVLSGDKTMLQETILRLKGLENVLDPIIVCNTEHRFIVLEQCRDIQASIMTILLEPVGRNTAAAVAAGVLQSLKDNKDATFLVLSADHIIHGVKEFYAAIYAAVRRAKYGELVIFGITPTFANTGYGYVKTRYENKDGTFKVENFIEKPNIVTAKEYINKDDYFWNSGMFVFKSKVFIDELKTFHPEIILAVGKSIDGEKKDFDFIELDYTCYKSLPNISIDCALMERSNNITLVPLKTGWNDIGAWDSLYDLSQKDINNNAIIGDVVTHNTHNTYINTNSGVVVTLGVKDLIIVNTVDAILISSKDGMQDMHQLIDKLKKQNRVELSNHRKVYRPWGWFDVIEKGDFFQVKRLHVNPHQKLSLQLHYKRSEHWVVVAGVASVYNNGDLLTLEKGESTFIPVGIKHSLENNSDELLQIIEVQSGLSISEEDIVRFEDNYGRVK